MAPWRLVLLVIGAPALVWSLAAYVGLALGARLVIGFSAGVLAGGWLSDVAGRSWHFSGKLLVCLATSALILPVAWGIDASSESLVMLAVPAYFLLSGTVTACGFSALLDVVPQSPSLPQWATGSMPSCSP